MPLHVHHGWGLVLAGAVGVLSDGRAIADVGPVPDHGYLIRTFTVDDGLRSDTLYDLTQDRDGYIWCASAVGIVRFDGVRFTVFDRDDTPGLATRAVYSVQSGPGGQMWVADEQFSLSIWREGRLKALPLRIAPDRASEQMRLVRPDSRGGLWIQSRENHVYRWREGPADPEPVGEAGPVPLPWPGNGPEWHEEPGRAPETLRYGLVEGGRFVAKADPDGIDTFRAVRCFPRVAGGQWMLEDTGQELRLRALSPAGTISAARRLPRSPGPAPVAYLEDREGNLWVALDGSGIQRTAPDGSVRLFTRSDGIPSDGLRALLLDREGNVWAATGGGGLVRFTHRRFRMLGRSEGLPSEIIYSVIPAAAGSGGGLWVASHGGGVQRFRDGRFVREPGFDAFPWALHVADDGALWVGDLMNGLGTLRADTAAQVIPGRRFDAICDDPSGGGWAGGEELCRWRGRGATNVTDWPGRTVINALACAPDGTLHIGTTTKGLWVRREGRFEPLSLPGCPADLEVSALRFDAGGVLWVGTTGHGLFQLRGGRSKALSVKEGLADNSVLGTEEDAAGDLWCTSPAGIFRIGRRELDDFFSGRASRVVSFRFDKEDGLATVQCTASSQPKIARTPDGRMWFATMRGLASTDPATMPVNKVPPPVVIERLDADGRALLTAGNGAAQIRVAPGTRRIEVQFTALSLTAPGKVRFRHRFTGRDTGWTEASAERRAVFEVPAPGPYRFEVTACNNDGLWNEEGAAVGFVVQPFFWQTLWFRAASVVAVLAIVSWAVRWASLRKVRRRLAQLERQQAIDRERSRIARDMHDEVGSALTQLTLASSPVDAGDTGAGSAETRLEQVAELSREIVGKLDELVWTVNPRHDTATGLVDYLSRHAEEALRRGGVRVRYDIAPGIASEPVPADRRHQLFLAFKEAVNNVVKHAGATEVRLRVRAEDGCLRITIEDDGRGLGPAPDKAGGDGLENMRARLDAIGGTCVVGPAAAGGTRVEFRLPMTGEPA